MHCLVTSPLQASVWYLCFLSVHCLAPLMSEKLNSQNEIQISTSWPHGFTDFDSVHKLIMNKTYCNA